MINEQLKKNIILKKKIFVLGGSGLIGNEVCKELSDFKTSILNLDIKEKNQI